MTDTEKELAKCVHALTENLSMSFKLQAGLCRTLATVHPSHSKEFLAAASGIDICATNLVRDLPKLPAG